MKKVALIAVVLLLAIGIFFYQINKKKQGASQQNKEAVADETPPPLREKQKQQLDQGTVTTTNKKLFEITGGNYYFTPNNIIVNKGDKVTIIFINRSGEHNFVLDDFTINLESIRPNQPAVVTFIADKKGTYDFYSTIDQDRQKGMKGTLIVQ